ncbi:MAG TPA: T9SS type A sorting domain-containing protein [Lentimicrobium sp.]|nr:T9SS type A sorting domain-containing protein [Lentimicrobium sp.]
MIKRLHTSFLVIILLLSAERVLSQAMYFDTVTFDTPTDKIIIEATPENIWQIGEPDKIFFDQVISPPNAIVTDTINSYPTNNVSSFIYIIRNAFTQDCYTSMQFWHKYDTDTIYDFCMMEASYDGGASWIIMKDTTLYENMFSMFWWDYDFHQATGQMTPHNNFISGTSDGWIKSVFNWQWYFGVYRDTIIANPDSLMIKFTFTSDSIDNSNEGWMIDQIFTSSGYWGGCGSIFDIDFEKNIDISPNPFSDEATIQFKESVENAELSLYNSFGSRVLSLNNVSGTEVRIYRNNLKPGLYILQITCAGKLIGAKRIVISD